MPSFTLQPPVSRVDGGRDADGWLHFGCTSSLTDSTNENAPDLTGRGRFEKMEHETGLEPATPTLAREEDPEESPPPTLS